MEIRNVSFSYGEKPIITDLSFSLAPGRRIAVMGESGRGKTTLLRLLIGQLKPSKGEIVTEKGEKPAVVFQEDRLLPWFTALKNVQLVSKTQQGCERFLEDMELSDSMNKLPKELSGGMQRRAAIARALAFGGSPLLLDEPFKGLDPDMRERIARKILYHAANDHAAEAAILLVTHDEREAELMKCEETIRLS